MRIDFIAFLTCCLTSFASEYHVATNGTSGGSGTISSPLSLAKALSLTSPAVPGDTIWIHGGTYLSNYTSQLVGSAISPIMVQQYTNEVAVLNGNGNYGGTGLAIESSYVWYVGFEIMNDYADRNVVRDAGVGFNSSTPGTGNKLINVILHDTGNAIFVSNQSTNAEVTGCVIYNNGYQLSDRGHGHGIYGQSKLDTKLLRDNIIFNQFDLGIQLYTASLNINNFVIDRNTIFGNTIGTNTAFSSENILVGGSPVSNITLTRNIVYMNPLSNSINMELVWGVETNGSAIIQSNYFAGSVIKILRWTNMVFSYNTVAEFDRPVNYQSIPGTNTYDWDHNHYYEPDGVPIYYVNGSFASGFDAHGTVTSANPTVSESFVSANPYDPKRGNVTVLNWDLSDNISVDPSPILAVGDQYEFRNAADYLAPACKSGIYSGGLISLPMTNLTVAIPVGHAPAGATGPQFNVFVLLANHPSSRKSIRNATIGKGSF